MVSLTLFSGFEGMEMKLKKNRPDSVPRYFNRLVQLAGPATRIAKNFDWSDEHTSRVRRGKVDEPPYVGLVVELLEALPPKDWPEKWR